MIDAHRIKELEHITKQYKYLRIYLTLFIIIVSTWALGYNCKELITIKTIIESNPSDLQVGMVVISGSILAISLFYFMILTKEIIDGS